MFTSYLLKINKEMLKKLVFTLLFFTISGCSGVILGSTLTGNYFVSSFSSVFETKDEYLLEQKINKQLNAIKNLREEAKFDIQVIVIKNIIYAIGIAKDPSSKAYSMDFISTRYSNKYKIIDEVKVGEAKSAFGDSLIKTKIKTKFILTNGIRYANYYITVYNKEVIVVGAASDKYEASKAFNIISSTSGVKKIVNYVEVKDIGE